MHNTGTSEEDIVVTGTPNFLLNDIDNSITNGEQGFVSHEDHNDIFAITEQEKSFLQAQLKYRQELHSLAKTHKNGSSCPTRGGATECTSNKQTTVVSSSGMPWSATLPMLTSITRKVLGAASQAYATAWRESNDGHTTRSTSRPATEGNAHPLNKNAIAGEAGVGKGSSVARSAATHYPESKSGSGVVNVGNNSNNTMMRESFGLRKGANGVNKNSTDAVDAMTEVERNTSMLQPLTPAQFDEESEYILEQLQQLACTPFTFERLLEILENPTCFHMTQDGKLRGDKLQMSLRRCVLVTCPSPDQMSCDHMY